jgi:hypothetical protein
MTVIHQRHSSWHIENAVHSEAFANFDTVNGAGVNVYRALVAVAAEFADSVPITRAVGHVFVVGVFDLLENIGSYESVVEIRL